jgi:bacillolysin
MPKKSALVLAVVLVLLGLGGLFVREVARNNEALPASTLDRLKSFSIEGSNIHVAPVKMGTLRSKPIGPDDRLAQAASQLKLLKHTQNKQAGLLPPPARTVALPPGLLPRGPNLTPEQSKNLNRLRWGLVKDLRYQGDEKDGTVRMLASVALAAPGELQKETPLQTAQRFLQDNRELFLIKDPSTELTSLKVEKDALGVTTLRFGQVYQGLEVWPSQLTANVSGDGRLTVVTGAYAPTPDAVELKPKISEGQALSKAYGHIGLPESTQQGTAKLVIFAEKGGPTELAYMADLHGNSKDSRVFVSALSGKILLSYSTICTGTAVTGSGLDLFGQSRSLNLLSEGSPVHYNMRNTSKPMYNASTNKGIIEVLNATTNAVSYSTSLNSGHDAEAVSAAFNLSKTYDFYYSILGRNSFDGIGASITAFVRQPNPNGTPMNNAYWTGSFMAFGSADKFAGASDVVGHEYTHAVVQYTAQLIYNGESGALNESFADIFGECFENYLYGTNDWLMGSFLQAPGRDMVDPTAYGQPGSMSDFVRTTQDNGGVHTNSGIPNRSFYQLVQGLPSGGIGLTQARSIFYRALATKLNARSNFLDLRLACVLSAEELYGAGSTQANKTKLAFDAVEIFDATAVNLTPDNLTPPSGPDSYLFSYLAVDGNYYLGRREAAMGDGSGVQGIAPYAISTITHPSVSGDGSMAAFVMSNYDLALVGTNGSSPFTLGSPGLFNSAAISPDAKYFAAILRDPNTGLPVNSIFYGNLETGASEQLDLYVPVIDGPNTISLSAVDEIDFSPDGQLLFFDGLAQTTLADGSTIIGWSIFAADLRTKTIYSLIGPVSGLSIGNPSSSRIGTLRIAFETTDGTNGAVYTWDIERNLYATVQTYTDRGYYVFPRFTAADDWFVFTQSFFSFTYFDYMPRVARIALQSDHITPTGSVSTLQDFALSGAGYRRGTFAGAPNLTVSVNTPSVVGGQSGSFRIARVSGDQAIRVPFSFKTLGTATPGVDYQKINLEANLPAGTSYLDISVSSLLPPETPTRTLTLSLDPHYHYKILSGGSEATMNLTAPALTYAYWATSQGVGAASADDDGDHLSNLFEYAIGSNAKQRSSVRLQANINPIALQRFLEIKVARSLNRAGITWTLERSTNLTLWEAASTAIVSSTDTEIVLRDTQPLNTDARRFIRVKVTEP